uniref:Uncharacterized protein n=1 Tax=Arundo donax TaxID=35708 RepID=A0A0A9EFY6_ARUDO
MFLFPLQPFWKVLQEGSSRGRSVVGTFHMFRARLAGLQIMIIHCTKR